MCFWFVIRMQEEITVNFWPLSLSVCLFICLSLCLTHTHTHTLFAEKGSAGILTWVVSVKLMVTAGTCRCAHVKSRAFICVPARALSPSFAQGFTRAAASRVFLASFCGFCLVSFSWSDFRIRIRLRNRQKPANSFRIHLILQRRSSKRTKRLEGTALYSY